MRVFVPLFLTLALASIGCARPGVERRSSTLPSIAPLPATIVFANMGRPPIAVGIGQPDAELLSAESEVRRLDLTERALFELFASAGTADRVLAGEDIGPSGSGPTTFVVSYHVTSFQEHFDGPEARFWVAYVVSCLTAGLGMLIAIDSRANFTHTYEFEVRVHDVRAAQVVRVSMPDGSFRNVYDTSSAPLVLRRTHSAELRSWIGAGGAPSGRELDDFLRAQAEEVARTMYALSGEDVWRAITSASRVAPPTAPPLVSSGGEVSSP